MIRTVKRLTAMAGIAAAVVAAGPVSSAFAATSPITPLPQPSFTFPTITNPFLPGQPQQPSGTCPANQGLFPGIPNLGPTGPMGPLGAYGPLGSGHLPCGASIWDLGPGGPLGPGGALGPGGLLGG
jgi:hypothetical protein